MPDQVSEGKKSARSAEMIEMGEQKRRAYEESFIGKEVEVLVEEEIERNGEIFVDRTYKRIYENCTTKQGKPEKLYRKSSN